MYLGLFRLWNEVRVAAFLSDLLLDMDWFRQQLEMKSGLGSELVDPEYFSLTAMPEIQYLTVFLDDELLKQFLCGSFNALDWNKLSLHMFLTKDESKKYWLSECTHPGRERLALALNGVRAVCYGYIDRDPQIEIKYPRLIRTSLSLGD
jgi:hypothetical protein